ncbi:MAG: HDOD domain-containing protein [Rhodocyclaceae bacterium]
MGLQDWVERIRDRDMPVFGHTVDGVRNITGDENASIGQLSRVILQDPALTAKVLKIANSVMFNPARQPVSTVSRAVTVMGFDGLGDIVLSLCLIDAFLSGGLRGRVLAEMARCFHAAVQARSAAAACGVQQVEEVFIAALLGRVGEMAFWCFGADAATLLDEAMIEQPDERPDNLQMDILGFRLRSLTSSLAKEWRLGSMVVSAAEPGAHPSNAEKAIALGYRLAAAAECGWHTTLANKAIQAYADLVGCPEQEAREIAIGNATEAARVAAQFGAADAAKLIPVPGARDAAEQAGESSHHAPDQKLQLKILRDLAMMLAGKPSLNDVLLLVLEGIYRGLGMHQAVFALLSPDRTQLLGKAGLGSDADALVKRFQFRLDGARGDVVNEVFLRNEAFWLKEGNMRGLNAARLEKVTGQQEAFIAPISTHGRAIGVFYADCGVQVPDEEIWEGFLHFVQQASLSFEHVAAMGAGGPKRQ